MNLSKKMLLGILCASIYHVQAMKSTDNFKQDASEEESFSPSDQGISPLSDQINRISISPKKRTESKKPHGSSRSSSRSSGTSSPLARSLGERSLCEQVFNKEKKSRLHELIDDLGCDDTRENVIKDLKEKIEKHPELIVTIDRYAQANPRAQKPLIVYAKDLYAGEPWLAEALVFLLQPGSYEYNQYFHQDGKTRLHRLIDTLKNRSQRPAVIEKMKEYIQRYPELVFLADHYGIMPLVPYAAKLYARTDWIDEVLDLLLNAGADVNAIDDQHCSTALHFATIANNINAGVVLMNYNADPNLPSKNGYVPLHIAAISNFESIVKMLLDHERTNPCIVDKVGATPLHFAGGRGKNGFTQEDYTLSLKQRKEYIAVNSKQVYLANIAKRCGIIDMLVEHGADVNAEDDDGYTASFYAIKYRHHELYEKLMEYMKS